MSGADGTPTCRDSTLGSSTPVQSANRSPGSPTAGTDTAPGTGSADAIAAVAATGSESDPAARPSSGPWAQAKTCTRAASTTARTAGSTEDRKLRHITSTSHNVLDQLHKVLVRSDRPLTPKRAPPTGGRCHDPTGRPSRRAGIPAAAGRANGFTGATRNSQALPLTLTLPGPLALALADRLAIAAVDGGYPDPGGGGRHGDLRPGGAAAASGLLTRGRAAGAHPSGVPLDVTERAVHRWN